MTDSMIRPSVLAAWHAFSEPLEGRVLWPYLDVRGLVTVGVGNLIDPYHRAVGLPWHFAGRPATPVEVNREWHRVAGMRPGLHYRQYVGPLRLTEAGVDALVLSRLHANAAALSRYWPTFGSWPADAQLGILSLAWAVGTGRLLPGPLQRFPKFARACTLQDWRTAAAECRIDPTGNPGVVPRTVAQRVCFLNAAANNENVALDPAECYWPLELVPCPE